MTRECLQQVRVPGPLQQVVRAVGRKGDGAIEQAVGDRIPPALFREASDEAARLQRHARWLS